MEEKVEVSEHHLIQQRIEKLKAIKEMNINPYPYSFDHKNHSLDLIAKYSYLEKGQETTDVAQIAGRIVAIRDMGKIAFMHILDRFGKIQSFVSKDFCDDFELFKKLDIGDIVGVTGIVFSTKSGEISVKARNITILTKTLRPLPEKYHGLKDPELRYRMRYVDLIVNPESRIIFEKRTKIIKEIRNYLDEKGFLEADTPCLQPIYGGAAARPFVTHLNALNMQVYLRISNELYLKRLLVGGFEKVYEFARDFRNEGIDRTHNPEFTNMEVYWAYADLYDMMKLTEDLYEKVCLKVNGTTQIKFGEHIIDFKTPWKRMTMIQAIKELAEIDVEKLSDDELKELVIGYNLKIDGDLTRGKIIMGLFEELCESKLIQPTFITQHPKESSPLCKADREKPEEFIERFEPFCAGFEIANAYSELNDPMLQKKLLEEQANELRGGSEEAHPMDEDFVRAMEYGMPPAGGVGIGIDRMIMLLTGQDTIREVLFFPFMKPEQK